MNETIHAKQPVDAIAAAARPSAGAGRAGIDSAVQLRLMALAEASPRAMQLRHLQARADAGGAPLAQLAESRHANDTGLPDQLKSGIESMSGISLDSVKVHYNSPEPAQLNAHAYAQGSEIHLAPGQEKHLPHEAWHVVQQAQGRVQPTRQMKGGPSVNDDRALEAEADAMGSRALATVGSGDLAGQRGASGGAAPVQRVAVDFGHVDQDEDDGHVDGEPQRARLPVEGDLEGPTRQSYESQIEGNPQRYAVYYGESEEATLGGGSSDEESVHASDDEASDPDYSDTVHFGFGRDKLRDGGGRVPGYRRLREHRHHPYARNGKTFDSGVNAPIQMVLKNLTMRSDRSGPYPFDYTLGGNFNIDFSNNVGAGNKNPILGGTQVDLTTGVNQAVNPKSGMTRNGRIVKIAPNGSRAQHFSMADRINPGAAAIRAGKWTWHHLDAPYHMVLVDSNVHNPGYGGFFHWGGMAFWT
ncbi:eCIS core domain-containing protein [Derxia lacustris]|uniref:eCIS core domain-containing protein n=1 Tax=Derxia lacustris TaxID=764842 RepID=UPI000A17044D|nr:DUF4157 domain-containing protein [Derxia lacustris]